MTDKSRAIADLRKSYERDELDESASAADPLQQFERWFQQALAAELPESALVMETDAPDIPPHWLYATAAQRAAGQSQGRNAPAELPRIAAVVADLRGLPLAALARSTTANACAALPRLASLLP